MASSRKRTALPSPTPNGDLPPEGGFSIPDDTLIVVRTDDGQFAYAVNGPSKVPKEAWPVALRRVATLLERQIVDGA